MSSKPETVFYDDCETPPPFKEMLPSAVGYIATTGQHVLYGCRKDQQDHARYRNQVLQGRIERKLAAKLSTCQICDLEAPLTKHHVFPISQRRILPKPKGWNRIARICRDCHDTVHILFSNRELALIPWTEVMEAVKRNIKPTKKTTTMPRPTPRPTHDPDEILREVATILAEQLGCEPEDVTLERKLEDLGADSLDNVEIIMAVEEQWNIDVDDEEADPIRTVAQVVELIRSKTSPEN